MHLVHSLVSLSAYLVMFGLFIRSLVRCVKGLSRGWVCMHMSQLAPVYKEKYSHNLSSCLAFMNQITFLVMEFLQLHCKLSHLSWPVFA